MAHSDLQPKRPGHFEAARAIFTELQQRALAAGVTRCASPPPAPTTGCGRGCNGLRVGGFLRGGGYWQQETLLLMAP